MILRPETVIGWHRKGFRLFWAWKVRHGKPGRPGVPKEVPGLTQSLLVTLSRRVRQAEERAERMGGALAGL